MDSVTITRSHTEPEPCRAPAAMAGGPGLPRRHVRSCVSVHAKRFACSQEGCHHRSTRRVDLNVHFRIHSGERPCVCPYAGCGRTFTQLAHLTAHQRLHTGEKPFACPHESCGRAFTQASTLKAHLRRHTGEKPFVCPHAGCGRPFTQSITLSRHLRLHTGATPFVCSHEGCESAFAQPGALTYHWRVAHTGTRPFVCSRCGHAFVQSGHLARHKCRQSAKEPFSCIHEGGGRACTESGHQTRHRHGRTRGNRRRGQQGVAAVRPLSVETPWLSSTAVAASPAQADLNLEMELAGSNTCVSCDKPGSIASVSSGISEPFDWSPAPSDRPEQRATGLNLFCLPPSPGALAGWTEPPSVTEAFMSDWSTGGAADQLFGQGLPLIRWVSTQASDKDVPASLRTEEDRAFWQALISPTNSEW